MKFRATVLGVEQDGHPIQSFSQDQQTITTWAFTAADKRQANVQVFAIQETSLGIIEPAIKRAPKKIEGE